VVEEDAAMESTRIDAIELEEGVEAALEYVSKHTDHHHAVRRSQLRLDKDSSMQWLRITWKKYEEAEVKDLTDEIYTKVNGVLKSNFKDMYGPLKAQFEKLKTKWLLLCGREITIYDIEFDHIVPLFLRRQRFEEGVNKSNRLLHWNIQVLLKVENRFKNAWYPGLYLPPWLSDEQHNQIDEMRWELVYLMNGYNYDQDKPGPSRACIIHFQTLMRRMSELMEKFEQEHNEQRVNGEDLKKEVKKKQ
jgi:5-methylcytosine-specific restriction endonuclease McrA